MLGAAADSCGRTGHADCSKVQLKVICLKLRRLCRAYCNICLRIWKRALALVSGAIMTLSGTEAFVLMFALTQTRTSDPTETDWQLSEEFADGQCRPERDGGCNWSHVLLSS